MQRQQKILLNFLGSAFLLFYGTTAVTIADDPYYNTCTQSI